jgi:hypothetical protein
MLRLAYMFGIMYFMANVFQTSSIKLSIPNTQVIEISKDNVFQTSSFVTDSNICFLIFNANRWLHFLS